MFVAVRIITQFPLRRSGMFQSMRAITIPAGRTGCAALTSHCSFVIALQGKHSAPTGLAGSGHADSPQKPPTVEKHTCNSASLGSRRGGWGWNCGTRVGNSARVDFFQLDQVAKTL